MGPISWCPHAIQNVLHVILEKPAVVLFVNQTRLWVCFFVPLKLHLRRRLNNYVTTEDLTMIDIQAVEIVFI